MNALIIIDYNPKDKVPPINESFLDKYLVMCYTNYGPEGTLSVAVRRDEKVCFSGVVIRHATKQLRTPEKLPVLWNASYNYMSKNLLNLMSNKCTNQNHAKHTFYVVKNLEDLSELAEMYNLQNSKFLEILQERFKVVKP